MWPHCLDTAVNTHFAPIYISARLTVSHLLRVIFTYTCVLYSVNIGTIHVLLPDVSICALDTMPPPFTYLALQEVFHSVFNKRFYIIS